MRRTLMCLLIFAAAAIPGAAASETPRQRDRSPGSPAAIQEGKALDSALDAAFESWEAGRPVDIPGLRARIGAYLKTSADAAGAFDLVRNYLYLAEAVDLRQAAVDWAIFRDSPNASIRGLAESKLRFERESSWRRPSS